MQLDVINYTENHVLAKVVEEDGFVWYFTGFYGWPKASQKMKSWALLAHLSTFIDGPWCCIGDLMRFCLLQKNKVPIHHHLSKWRSLA